MAEPTSAPIIQIFGTRKCPQTRKAVRFFKERGVRVQEVDLAERPLSPGELRSVAAQLGWAALLDREGARFRDRGLRQSLLGDPDFDREARSAAVIERLLLADPLLLRTPVVRRGKQAALGYQPEAWSGWITKKG